MKYLIFIVFICIVSNSSAQDSLSGTFNRINQLKDTSLIIKFEAFLPDSDEPLNRNEISLSTIEIDKTRATGSYFAHLGTWGSSAKPLRYDAVTDITFDMGFHAYDLYQLRAHNLPFYYGKLPYTRVMYSQVGGQNNSVFEGEFGREIHKNLMFSLGHKRVTNLGFYQHQQTKHSALNMGIWWRNNSGTYNGWLTYANNFNNEQHNGGILSDSLFGESIFNERSAIPVRNNTANTRYTHYEIILGQDIPIIKGKNNSAPLVLVQRSKLLLQRFKFSDPNPDSAFYGRFFTYPQGSRYYSKNNALYNYGGIRFSKGGWSLEPGAAFNRFDIVSDTSGFIWDELWLQGKGAGTLGPVSIQSNAQYGFADNNGSYKFETVGTLDIKKWGLLTGTMLWQRYPGTVMNFIFEISKQAIWDQRLDRTSESQQKISLLIRPLKLNVEVKNITLDRYIYFDTTGLPVQDAGRMNIQSLTAKHQLQFKGFHFNNTLSIQVTDKDILRIPQYITEHQLYYEGKILWNKLLSQSGIKFRHISSYRADNFMPASGQFILQNSTTLPSQWMADVFINAQIRNFSFFIVMEQANAFWDSRINYFTPLYPIHERRFRFGLQWRFLN